MTREEIIDAVAGLRERYSAPYSQADRALIVRLYSDVLGKTLHGSCQNCYHDAVIELHLFIKNHKTMAKDKKFLLKAGAVIYTPKFHDGTIYTNANLTDEIAAEYLGMFPGRAVLFSNYDEVLVNKASKAEAKKAAKTAAKKEPAEDEAKEPAEDEAKEPAGDEATNKE